MAQANSLKESRVRAEGKVGPHNAEGLAPERDASTARPTYGPTRNRTENLLIRVRMPGGTIGH